MSVQAGSETRSGIGTRLRAGRERKGYTVLQAAEKMHVDPKILESLESEDFEALGAPVFVRGHLRHYAELVGEPPAELQALYASNIRAIQPDLTRIPKGEAPSDARRMAVPAIVVLVGFAIAGGVWWVVTLPGAPHGTAIPAAAGSLAPASSDTTGSAESPALARASAPPGTSASPGVSAPPGTSAPPGVSAAGGLATPPRASMAPLAPGEAALPVGRVPGEGTSGGTTARAARQAELTLRFNAESWAEVYDSSGERLFYDVGSAASVRTFKGTPPLRVVLGNAPGVAVEVNGRSADLASLTRPDGSAQFLVGRAGRLSQSTPQ